MGKTRRRQGYWNEQETSLILRQACGTLGRWEKREEDKDIGTSKKPVSYFDKPVEPLEDGKNEKKTRILERARNQSHTSTSLWNPWKMGKTRRRQGYWNEQETSLILRQAC